ncbi:MAG: methyltransferase [Deltaproteobacteria bacterium]|jgi:tRNA1(Val) A37 N6-methylase TrmN6|nr:methyltransferase [Deltaproteobacteria bacterium]
MSAASFPRGLVQPEGSFRFSADALLLAAFAPGEEARRAADLGTGCGVVAFGLALRFPGLYCTGLDKEAALIEAARVNASMLGLGERMAFAQGGVADKNLPDGLGRESCELVTANPPYRVSGTGRRISSPARRKALEAPQGALADFAAAAAFLLRHHGRFACVLPPARLGDAFAALRSARLEPRRLRCVHPRPCVQAGLVLVEARKNARPDLVMEAPLILHPDERGSGFSREALAFCPWLGAAPA